MGCKPSYLDSNPVIETTMYDLENNALKLMNHQPDLQYTYYSNPVQISTYEFVIAIESNKQLIKYNANSKEWSQYFNYDDDLEEKMRDWTLKTNFKKFKYVGYLCDNGKVAVGEMVRQCENKIFLHFNNDFNHYFGAQYSWINVPNNKLCVPKSVPGDNDFMLSFDETKNVYYIISQYAVITTIHIKTKKIKYFDIDDNNYNNTGIIKSCLVINGILHMMADVGDEHYCHTMFDTENGYRSSKVFPSWVIGEVHGLIYVHVPSDCILFFVGKAIFRYSLNQQIWKPRWKKLDVVTPDNLKDIFFTNNERIVMMFGSRKSIENCYLDLQTMQFTTLDIRWPSAYCPKYALCIGNMGSMNIKMIIIFGFARDVWNNSVHCVLFPFICEDVVRVIVTFYEEKYIHFFRDKLHWTMDIVDLYMPFY